MHLPVLVAEILEQFAGRSIRSFFDGTLGGGGHARALLEAHPEIECYVGCDRDPDALEMARNALREWRSKVRFVHGSYAQCEEWMNREQLDGFLIDAGVSSMQIDRKERGFSFQGTGPLDMRMDPTQELTAEQIVNHMSEGELARIFYEYGEERRSRAIARAIVIARKKQRIRTTEQLVGIIVPVARRTRGLHPATLVFQALRIAVNNELQELELGMQRGIDLLSPRGRIAVIAFHRLEDRIVKRTLRKASDQGQITLVTKKPIGPSREEIRNNPRSRSAKLRVGEKN
jgi:16S rRNA (cytosine1402-N4)-methyltransferase